MLSPKLGRLSIGTAFVFVLMEQVCSQSGFIPEKPVPNPSDDPIESIRFGITQYSRQEFAKDASFMESVLDDSVFSLEFKTRGDSGVLFYVGGRTSLTDHVGLFMQDGRITYVFDCGSGSAVMTSRNTYNDGRWHQVVFSREAREGRLAIDDEEDIQDTSPGMDRRVNAKLPFYVGGLSERAAEQSKHFLKGVNSSFPGCIRKVEAQGEVWTAQKQTSAWNTSSCSSRVEGGAFWTDTSGGYFLNCECGDHTTGCKFLENGLKKCLCDPGYEDKGGKCTAQFVSMEDSAESVHFGSTPYSRQEYTLDPEFLESIWDDSVFSLEFKTLGETGLIFFVGGLPPNIDNIGLFMQHGKITYVFDCGSGPAVMTSENTYNDGQWHQVIFSRQAREGRLVIDGEEEVLGTSPGKSNQMDSRHPFYVGGLSKEGNKEFRSYVKDVSLSFPGCIRNVEAQGMVWTSEQLSTDYKTTTCFSKVEGGTFFYSSGGYLVLHCKCGDYSTGCRFKEDGAKECLCSEGYVDRGGICATLSITVEKILDDATHYESDIGGQCALPLHPRPDSNPDPAEGVRFGNTPHSRQEFAMSGEFLEGVLDDSVISLDFKTTGESGVLFYVGEGVQHLDYLGLFMRKGRIHFVYELSRGIAAMVTTNKYNDGAWHHAVFWRHSREGRLIVDGVEVVHGVSPSPARHLNVKSPFYVGGLSEEAAKRHAKNIRNVTISFPGCIRNVEFQNVLWTPEMQKGAWNTSACSRTEEKGTFFSAEGGYLILIDKFRVGQEMTISMDIKPRTLSGVLMSVHGRTDYLVLQMINGSVHFTVDNGDGPVTATYTPREDDAHHLLCDGRFHSVQATSHSDNQVTLSVDGVVSEGVLKGVGRVSSTDTFDPLYVGGVPDSSKNGIKTKEQFVGCVRNLKLNGKRHSMSQGNTPYGRVTLNFCPTT